MDDLDAEMRDGKRSSIGWPETGWALDYERSLLPPGTRFPQKGDVYAATRPYPTSLLISWRSPVTTDAPCTLPAGCRISIQSECTDRPIVVYAVPLDYDQIEKAALSRWIRWRPGYAGYYLAVSTRDLNSCFVLEPQSQV